MPALQFREYRLCTLLHKTPEELDESSAIRLEWLLAVDGAVSQAQKDMQDRASR